MDEFKQETIRSHFSHPHPLKLITYHETLNLSSHPLCSGCMLKPSGMLYSCTICQDYFLHKKCFEMPKKLTHPFHKKHALTLMPKPAYGEVLFVCDACRQRGNGFSYHCKHCGFDLHILCAIMPLSITHESHIMHKLNLTCASNKKFSCDLCMSLIGSRQWLYRCNSCGFNAHLKCVAPGDDDPVVPAAPSLSNERTPQEGSRFAPTAPSNAPPPNEVNRSQNNDLALFAVQQVIIKNSNTITQVIEQMIMNNSKAIAQAILSGGVGGRSGENRGLHLLIELICTISDSGIISGGDGHDSVNNGGGGDATDSGGGGGGSGLCENLGSRNNRLYRCNSCASTGVPPVLQQPKFMETPPPPPPPPQSFGRPPCDGHMMNNIQIGFPAASPTHPPFGANTVNNDLALDQMISNNNNTYTATTAQALLLSAYSGSRGGSVFGGYRPPELHLQLMQRISNGGGGDQDSPIQAVLINSGGGMDFSRSLPGDGNGN